MEERSAHLARSTSDGSEVLGTHLYMFYEVLKVWEAHWLWGDLGSYELKRSPCEMQMEECSAHLARSTSDGSADECKRSPWMQMEEVQGP